MAEAAIANNTTQRMTLVDWLDDLTVRFLLNLPPSELSSIPRICFQIEEAQWFYEDFIRPANPSLPGLNLRQFLLALFQHCPLLQGFDAAQHVAAYEAFLSYKTRVPVRGAILLDDDMEQVLLVKGWKKGASWSFPRGKINKNEPDLDCAIREVYEETGFDMAAAGLVQTNLQQNGQVKAIDITMKEQNMKLFVFRGVALGTHFEPKTRKEISKIQWYSIKDLPGFKKQKGGPTGNAQGDAQSSKFYMVAPFIGHLKKWINQQRKTDIAAFQAQQAKSTAGTHGVVQTAGHEDEGETEQEDLTLDVGASMGDRPADELKRLLSIRGPSLSVVEQNEPPDHTSNLLAMLRSSETGTPAGGLPHTPFDRIDPIFPAAQPQTPHPHHPRRPQEQPNVPQFPYPPEGLPQQHPGNHNFPTPAPGHRPNANHFGPRSPARASGLPPHMQHHGMQHYNRQPGVPGSVAGSANGPQFGPFANAAASSLDLFQQTQASLGGYFSGTPVAQHSHNDSNSTGQGAQLASPMQFETGSKRPPPAVAQILQDSQKPIGSETPEASKLPNLNVQSKKLLDAFKTSNVGKAATIAPTNASFADQRAGSLQQAALLGLFEKPGAIPISPQQKSGEVAPVSPEIADITVTSAPPRKQGRQHTLNEITRTLPPGKLPTPAMRTSPAPSAERLQQRVLPVDDVPEPVKHENASQNVSAERSLARGQLFDPANPKKSAKTAFGSRKEGHNTAVPPVAILQRNSSQQGVHTQKNVVPKIAQSPNSNENGQPAAAISILQRPGSSTGRTRSFVPPSPLRHEAQGSSSNPQLLTGTADQDATISNNGAPVTPTHKKNHLLSLFAKAPVVGGVGSMPAAGSSTMPTSRAPTATQETNSHDALLKILNSGTAPSIPSAKIPDPPPAPQLMPERKTSSQNQSTNRGQAQHSQQLLLNLFHKPSSSTASSPSTPISPFTLGTPISREPPHVKPSLPASLPSSVESRSRLGSVTSAVSNGTPNASRPATPTSATPTNETKGFLLDYLNGVVQKEGYKGPKRG